MIQQSFADLVPSEKAAVLSAGYGKVCGTLKGDELVAKLQALSEMEGYGIVALDGTCCGHLEAAYIYGNLQRIMV